MSVEAVAEPIAVREPWEILAGERLAELLTHPQLEESLGPLLKVVRQARRRRTGVNRRGNKAELADAIVLQRGVDLLSCKKIRALVAAACQLASPAAWFPGKASAIAFAEAAGFPPEMAGTPSGDRRRHFEYLLPRVRLKPLLPFQLEVKRKLKKTLYAVGGRANLTLPTGGGKTRVAVEAIREWLADRHAMLPQFAPGKTVVWLAHTEELCEQAFACFKQVWQASTSASPLHLIRFWGSYSTKLATANFDLRHFLSNPSVLVSTPQRMLNDLERTGDRRLGDAFRHAVGAIFIDEAHRAGAPTYKKIMDALRTSDSPAPVIGLTATPYCKEYLEAADRGVEELQAIFKQLIEPSITLGDDPRQALEEFGVLAIPKPQTIRTHTSIRLDSTTTPHPLDEAAIERLDLQLAKQAAKDASRRRAILGHLVPIARDPQNSILYFGPSVLDAESMALLLRDEGIAAAVVSGRTRASARREIIERFKAGKIRVLCNCEVLTVGFDAPRVTHLMMARPTVSRVLYEQILGRGLRGPMFGGTETCVVIDCEDDFPNGRPELGYQAFRRIWRCEEAKTKTNDLKKLAAAFAICPSHLNRRQAHNIAKRLKYLENLDRLLSAELNDHEVAPARR